MKKIKVSIQDENTLILLEDAQKGDLIDLKSIHEADIDKTSIDALIKSIKTSEFNAQLEAAKQNIAKQKELEAELKTKDIVTKKNEELAKKIKKLQPSTPRLKALPNKLNLMQK